MRRNHGYIIINGIIEVFHQLYWCAAGSALLKLTVRFKFKMRQWYNCHWPLATPLLTSATWHYCISGRIDMNLKAQCNLQFHLQPPKHWPFVPVLHVDCITILHIDHFFYENPLQMPIVPNVRVLRVNRMSGTTRHCRLLLSPWLTWWPVMVLWP